MLALIPYNNSKKNDYDASVVGPEMTDRVCRFPKKRDRHEFKTPLVVESVPRTRSGFLQRRVPCSLHARILVVLSPGVQLGAILG